MTPIVKFCKGCGAQLDANWKTLCVTCFAKQKETERSASSITPQPFGKYAPKSEDTAARIARSTGLAQAVATADLLSSVKTPLTTDAILQIADIYSQWIITGSHLPKVSEELVQ